MKNKTIILTILITLTIPTIQAQTQQEARQLLNQANQSIQKLENLEIPHQRQKSLYTEAQKTFKAQKALKQEGGTPDFTRVKTLVQQIKQLEKKAIQTNDKLKALKQRLNTLKNQSQLNYSQAEKHQKKAQQAFQNQRYQRADNQIEQAYQSISKTRSLQAQLTSFTQAQRKNLVNYIQQKYQYAQKNWKKVSTATAALLIISISSFKLVKYIRYQKKLEKLEKKAEILDQLISETQDKYYVKKDISQMEFKTKIEKFRELETKTQEQISTVEKQVEQNIFNKIT